MGESEKPTARRVEHMKCPKCGEILLLERDHDNMSILPTCPCGHRVSLGNLLGQMSDCARQSKERGNG